MGESVTNYTDIFIKQGKPVAQDIKLRIDLFNLSKPILYHRKQRISKIEL